MDIYNRSWIIEHSIPVVQSYKGDITLRALHYRLVAMFSFPNTIPHYKRVIAAMTAARWAGLLEFDDFVDHDREQLGETAWEETVLEEKIQDGIELVDYALDDYRKNIWENQPNYVEVWIEKKALISAFERHCKQYKVGLCPCKGYPSLTFMNDAAQRYRIAGDNGKNLVMLYFGDYDPSGEDIPRSIDETLFRMGAVVRVERIALMEEQVISMGLPPAPTKAGDSRSANWDGIGQVELDAIEPRELGEMAIAAINKEFDADLLQELRLQEIEERKEYVIQLKDYVKTL